MIPKIIHYIWLSKDPKDPLTEKCIESWKRIMPDYELMCWDTDRFDISICPYTEEAFRHEKWAFVSDYIRLYALYHVGGVYLDTDVEVVRKFDDLLDNAAFTGFENSYSVAAWLMGSKKGNPLFKKLMTHYDGLHFERSNGTLDMTPNPYPITKELVQRGLKLDNTKQDLEDITIYPLEYFGAYDSVSRELNLTENSYAFHYYNGAWMSDEQKEHKRKRTQIRNKYGKFTADVYEACHILKQDGVKKLYETIKYSHKRY